MEGLAGHNGLVRNKKLSYTFLRIRLILAVTNTMSVEAEKDLLCMTGYRL